MSAAIVTFRTFIGADGFVEVGVRCASTADLVGLISRPCQGANWLVYKGTNTRPVAKLRTRKAAEAFFQEAGG